jgi:acetoin utilization deacetylase AcuC-like enzyme
MAESNGLVWSAEFRDSVLLTNGCLLAALTAAVETPQHVMMAPVSGFHHARPDGGSGFCTFSGQAIAALELFQRRGLRGAWIDLDGHYGNSIEDTRDFAEDLDSAIPPGLNLNPMGAHGDYLRNLEQLLRHLEASADLGKLDYVAVAHGADSHEWDQLGYQCSTAEWLQAADMVYSCLARIRIKNQRIAVALGLFGGYRDDHPESVLGLHAMDAARALVHLAGISQLAGYVADVRPRVR